MRTVLGAAAARRGAAGWVAGAAAQDTIKIGLLATLEGPFTVARPGRHARRGAGAQGKERHGRRQEDRVHQGLVRRHAGQGRERHAQAGRAGQGADHDRAAVGRRGHRGQELLEDPAQHHFRQRLVGRARRPRLVDPSPNFFRFNDRRRAVAGGAGRACAWQKGYKKVVTHRRGLRLPLLPGAGLHDRATARGAATSWTSPGCRSGTKDYSSVIAKIPTDVDAV